MVKDFYMYKWFFSYIFEDTYINDNGAYTFSSRIGAFDR